MKKWLWWGVCLVVVAGLGVGLYVWQHGPGSLKAKAGEVFGRQRRNLTVRVEVCHPVHQGLDRTTVQPGTVQAFESADLFCEVSGYLEKLHVDIGQKVKKDQVLAEVAVPELVKQQVKSKALVKQAEARVELMNAGLARANAEYEAAEKAVPQAKATLAKVSALKRYRMKRYERIRELFKNKGVEEWLVDETLERRDEAIEAERSAQLGVYTAEAQEKAAKAKIAQAKADIADAEAQVAVAEAEHDRVGVLVGLATIRSPYTGVVTKRNLFPGGFVRSAKEGERVPLLSVDRTDKLRVVVQIPDREVPYADRGDPAIVEFDVLGGKTFKAPIARTQGAEDALTRTMRVEVDLDNPRGQLRPGMFARVSILLQKGGTGLSIPSGCLVGAAKEGQASVFVVRDGKALLTPVRTGLDNGVRVEILSGLSERDQVVRRYSGSLANGTPVTVSDVPPAGKGNGSHS